MSRPLRVLQVVTSMDRAGLETILMNYYRHVDRNMLQFDFLTHRQREGVYDKEIRSLGGQIYRLPPVKLGTIYDYWNQLYKFFMTHKEYKIVHSHIDSLSTLPLFAAKCSGTPVRIAHSHISGFDKDLKYVIRILLRSLIPCVATDYYACGNKAGEFMFRSIWKNKGMVITNAINASQFIYTSERRYAVRKAYDLTNNFVIGHIGRFDYQKNHHFLIDVFKKVFETNENAKLLLIGGGAKEKEIEEKVQSCGLKKAVEFLGIRSDIADLMNAMDILLLPSHYEGLPVVLVEAQAAGLPCIASTAVSKESALTDLIAFVDLDIDLWNDAIHTQSKMKREDRFNEICEAGFDIEQQAKKLQQIYLDFNDN